MHPRPPGNAAPSSRAKRFRELVESPKILLMPGVFDCFSCRVAEMLGFEAALISGAGISESRIGKPDVGVLGLDENLAATRALTNSVRIPLLVDGETGYGGAVNTYLAVQQFERAGAAAIMIEDQVWPQRNSSTMDLIPADAMRRKLRAALDAREDPDLVLLARTDSGDFDDAVRRANLYAEEGADAIFATRVVSTPDAIERFVKAVPKPVVVNIGFGIAKRKTTPLISARELERLGVAVMMVARMLSAAAIRGMMNAVAVLKESAETGQAADRPDLLVPLDDLNALMGIDAIRALEERYGEPAV